MSFVAKHILSPHERLIGIARLHWIYIVMGLFWAGIVAALGFALQYAVALYGSEQLLRQAVEVMDYPLGPRSAWISAVFGLTAVALFMAFYIEYLATEVAITNERIIRKSGLIAVEVQEIDLKEIESARIHHGWGGAILGYGSIYLDCRFVGDVHLPAIRRPYQLLRALHKIKDQSSKEHKTTSTSDKI